MELSRGQEEYLLELLNAEYTIAPEYRQGIKDAVSKYSGCTYDDDDLEFLVDNPQSLSAIMRLNTTDSLPIFKKYFTLWCNMLEYNIFDTDTMMVATIINPDPTSREKLLQIIDNDDHYQINPVPEIRYMNAPRSLEALSNYTNHSGPIVSAFTYQTFYHLMTSFLTFAEEGENHFAPAATAQADYPTRLAEAITYSLSRQSSWQDLRQKALQLPLISSTYVFNDRSQGLILPSNIEFINYLNAQPFKKPKTRQTAPAESPFGFIDRLFKPNIVKPKGFKLPVLAPNPFIANKRYKGTAMPNHSHSGPFTKTTASKMPPPKKKQSRFNVTPPFTFSPFKRR